MANLQDQEEGHAGDEDQTNATESSSDSSPASPLSLPKEEENSIKSPFTPHSSTPNERTSTGEDLDTSLSRTEQSASQVVDSTISSSMVLSDPPTTRFIPVSFTIDMSPSNTIPKPPAYAESQFSPTSQHEFAPPQDISQPRPSSAASPQSSAAYRRPFLEEDELPEYITVSENGPPFKIPASQSTTYTVTPSQGPVEFQHQHHHQHQSSGSSTRQQLSHRPHHSRPQRTTSDGLISPRNSGQHAERMVDDDPDQRQLGAWTLEYWVDDTIMYLCYLMDPKLSATTALVPRTLDEDMRTFQPRISAAEDMLPVGAATTDSPASVRSITISAPQEHLLSHARQLQGLSGTNSDAIHAGNDNSSGRDHIRLAMVTTNPTDIITGVEQDGMERVPTGHIRGRPPPLNRNRNAASPYLPPGESTNGMDTVIMLGRRVLGGRQNTTTIHVTSPSESDIASGPMVVNNGTDRGNIMSTSNEEAPIQTTSSMEVDSSSSTAHVSTVAPSTADNREETDRTEGQSRIEDITETYTVSPGGVATTELAFGTLPSVQHIRINDGYPGEEADTLLAHAVDLQVSETERTRQSVHSNTFNNALTAEFFKNPTFAFVSAEDPQTWIWWSSHHENNLQRCRQEGPHEEVMMWWRTRIDFNSRESKARRRREKQRRHMGADLGKQIGIRDRLRALLSLRSSTPHHESMEITMRVRGLYYAWREETPEAGSPPQPAQEREQRLEATAARGNGIPLSDISPQPWTNTDNMRLFTLVRDDSLVMGQRVKGGPVAEIWIHGDSVEPQTSAPDHFHSIPTYQSTVAPVITAVMDSSGGDTVVSNTRAYTGEAPEVNDPSLATRSAASSVISYNGTTANTFMTEVSAFTGGPVRSTIASTFIHPAASDHPSSAVPSLGRRSVSSSTMSTSNGSSDSRFTSSFPPKLRQRRCMIRVLRGLNTEVETFALSTGPRLPELFDLYTDQSLPGPSKSSFVCALTTFGIMFLATFLAIALIPR